jgi:hypothetical protein
MVVLTGTRTGRIAVCTCWRNLTEWDFGTRTTTWIHDDVDERPDLCPGWREATPVGIREETE